jgi:hypothetical protein
MANNLWAAFIADNGSNDILTASSADGATWTPSASVNQTSPFTPSLALFEGALYCAFITDDEDSVTGVPSNRIFLCWTTDGVVWSEASFFNQYSKCAPSLAVWNGKLHIAFVANDPGDQLLVYFSATPQNAKSWSATVPTNQASANAPSLAAYGPPGQTGSLYMAFVPSGSNDITVCSVAAGGAWTVGPATKQSCHFSPSLAVLGGTLYLVFAAANGSKDLFLSYLESDGSWSGAVIMNQSSTATPSAVGFGLDLSVAFVGTSPNSSSELLLVSNSNPMATWEGDSLDAKQQSAAGPAIAVAPFAYDPVQAPQAGLSDASNYIFYSSCNPVTPITGLSVNIVVDMNRDLIWQSTTGGTGSGFAFQLNAYSQSGKGFPTGWQQYILRVNTSNNGQTLFDCQVNNWPQPYGSLNSDLINSAWCQKTGFDNQLATLQVNGVPGGYQLGISLGTDSDSNVNSATFSVTDTNGKVYPQTIQLRQLNRDCHSLPKSLWGPVAQGDLAPIVGFQLNLVGLDETSVLLKSGGAGTITYKASANSPLTTSNPTPSCAIATFEKTGENANSVYGPVAAGASTSIAQNFWIS